eukprot:m.32657 g.32657  ORF g.32657 m.32657 type:complete len:282 (-) comp5559_c0_seq1:122-967(-)
MFLDLHLLASDSRPETAARIAELQRLGYDGCAVTQTWTSKAIPSSVSPQWQLPLPMPDTGSAASRPKPFAQYSRITIVLEDHKQVHPLSPSTETFRNFDIVAVRPVTEKLFVKACADLDIDVISLDMSIRLPFYIKAGPIRQALDRGVFFEMTYGASIADSIARRNLITNSQSLVRIIKGRNLIISSEAESAFGLRGPYDVAVLGQLFGLNQAEAKACVAAGPRAVVLHGQMRKGVHKSVLSVARTDHLAPGDRWKAPSAAAALAAPTATDSDDAMEDEDD